MTPDEGTRFYRTATRPIVAAFLSLIFLWVLALSVSPRLHSRIHLDAGQAEHHCAVTLISAGNCEQVLPQLAMAPERPAFGEVLLLPWTTVGVTIFRGAALLEHAPPAHS
jgi:hypothetical protein